MRTSQWELGLRPLAVEWEAAMRWLTPSGVLISTDDIVFWQLGESIAHSWGQGQEYFDRPDPNRPKGINKYLRGTAPQGSF
jgi:hypothetical protein